MTDQSRTEKADVDLLIFSDKFVSRNRNLWWTETGYIHALTVTDIHFFPFEMYSLHAQLSNLLVLAFF